MKLVPNKTVRRTQDIVDIMDRTSVELFQRKKLALQQGDEAVLAQVGRGKDIMSILCMCQFLTSFRILVLTYEIVKENMEATEGDRLQEAELIAQITCAMRPPSKLFYAQDSCCYRTLIFAAMDTTSGAIARILSTLAEHPDAQDKLRQELSEARKTNDDLSYNDLSTLPYLDAVCRERMRL